MAYKPNVFRVVEFWDMRAKWDGIVPGYKEKREEAELAVPKLLAVHRFQPKYKLMTWFIDALRGLNAVQLQAVFDQMPPEEMIPDGGVLRTQAQFSKKHVGRVLDSSVQPVVEEPSVDETPVVVQAPDVAEGVVPGDLKLVWKLNPAAHTPAAVQRRSIQHGKPVFKMIANAHAVGGGEFSSAWLMQAMLDRGYRVQFHPVKGIGQKYLLPNDVEVCDSVESGRVRGPSDVLMFYANDAVYHLKKKNQDMWKSLLDAGKRNNLCVNFVMGESWQDWFSGRLHHVGFLNSTKRDEWVGRLKKHGLPVPTTFVLPPPVLVRRFLDVEPDYSKITFIRHGRISRKFDEDDHTYIFGEWAKLVPDAEYWIQPAPPYMQKLYGDNPRHHLGRWDEYTLEDFLSKGSLFHYRLPKKMADQGPRVIVEAMASGIPVIADNRDGAKDRVTPETGWLCDDNEGYVKAVQEILDWPKLLELKGRAAKARAQIMFDPQNWCREMIGC